MNINRVNPVSFKSVRIVEDGMSDQTKRAAHMMAGKLTENRVVDSLKEAYDMDVYLYAIPKNNIYYGDEDDVIGVSFVSYEHPNKYTVYKAGSMNDTVLRVRNEQYPVDNNKNKQRLYVCPVDESKIIKAMRYIAVNEFSKLENKDLTEEDKETFKKLGEKKYYEWHYYPKHIS